MAFHELITLFLAVPLVALMMALIFGQQFRDDVLAGRGEASVFGVISVKGAVIVLLCGLLLGGILFIPHFQFDVKHQIENAGSQPDPLHEVEARLGNLAVRLEEHDKRLADHRAYFTTLSSIVGIVFTIVVASGSVIGYLQFSNEKAALESFKQQVREDIEQQLGKAKDSSEIEILTATREPIEAPIPATFREGNPEIQFTVAFRNKGRSIARMTVVKVYTQDPLAKGEAGRSDEPDYPYEFSYRKEHGKLFFTELAPGDGDDMRFWFAVDNLKSEKDRSRLLGTTHDVKMKVYYGLDHTSEQEFKIKLQ